LVAPGYLAFKSVKWLERIVISENESISTFQAEKYTLFNSKDKSLKEQSEFGKPLHMNYANLNSVITNVCTQDCFLSAVKLTLKGYAFSGRGVSVK
jgi:DMSO/TMAO reductase YedYZ molybdopterin-dependent catalytic subunit